VFHASAANDDRHMSKRCTGMQTASGCVWCLLLCVVLAGNSSGCDEADLLQAYLISLYMDCPPGMGLHCPSAKERAAVEAAIRKGIITWHAFPHNAQVQHVPARKPGLLLHTLQPPCRSVGCAAVCTHQLLECGLPAEHRT
jgi:hypothetical protein